MKELPTGLQVFEYIRQKNGLYVDKTDMVYKMISGLKTQFFISRPRRFGKTLLCWTLNALFSGKRELFEGLAIAKTDWEWESYPVIHLDMSTVRTSESLDDLRVSLVELMGYVAREHEIDVSGTSAGGMLKHLIVETSRKYGKHVVVIVDEYDKPFLDFYNKPQKAEEVREILRDYYVQLKTNESHMRFLFMTGISKFTKAGVFSKLNNLNDLTLNENYGTMLGYTQEELTEYFSEHLEALAVKSSTPVNDIIERMKYYYNGFCFDGIHKVYNPFSALNFFDSGKFDNYWMESGSTKVIADLMKDHNLTVDQFRGLPVSRDFARNPGNIDTAPPESFLYQAGYLTLREDSDDFFLLDYPNTEVFDSMSRLVAENIIQSGGGEFMDFRTPLIDALREDDCELFIETINRLLASIPYDDYINAAKFGRRLKITAQEWLYRSTILAFLRGCGVLTFGEMHSNQGRSDLIVTCRGVTWVLEIKVAKNNDCAEQAQEAMKQINDNQYAAPYPNAKKVGIAIDDNTRQIGEWIEA
ncbi:MAG: ATP-binding protein [Chitinispirillales bacterium]|jgi:hypothetical protein|nr:ATP-binding protein [Chitinispirillales bacterium]